MSDEATIPIAGRFQRIENTLARIEEKLDLKANLAEVSRIDSRVLALENGTSPYSERLIRDFFETKQIVTTLQLENSKNLPLLAMIPELENRLSLVETQGTSNLAVKNALDASKENGLKLKWVIIGIAISALTSLAGLAIATITMVRHY